MRIAATIRTAMPSKSSMRALSRRRSLYLRNAISVSISARFFISSGRMLVSFSNSSSVIIVTLFVLRFLLLFHFLFTHGKPFISLYKPYFWLCSDIWSRLSDIVYQPCHCFLVFVFEISLGSYKSWVVRCYGHCSHWRQSAIWLFCGLFRFSSIGRRAGCSTTINTLFSTTITSIYKAKPSQLLSRALQGLYLSVIWWTRPNLFQQSLRGSRLLVLMCLPFFRLGCGCWFRPSDLQVMNLTS